MRIMVCSYVSQGYISYPRTETTSYPTDFDFRSILMELDRHPEFREYASTLLQSKISRPRYMYVAMVHVER